LVYLIIIGGEYFYIITAIAFAIFIFIFFWVYPYFIQPLFNTYKELEDGAIKTGIFELANRVNYPLTKIYEMDASQRSSHSNAYLYGIGGNKRIVLYDTLIKKLQPKEITATIGHELGHWKKWHFYYNLTYIFTLFFILFYLLKFFVNNKAMFYNFGFEQKSTFIGLFLFLKLVDPILFFSQILQCYMTRIIEYQADLFSCELGQGEDLKSALAKLSEENKSNLDPDPLYSSVNYTHPTLLERVKAINLYLNKSKKVE
jgi:STE24 endopeptidase